LSVVLHTAVSKKLLPRAVDRNRVKRLMREASRDVPLPSIRVLVRLTCKPVRAFSMADRQCKRLLREELDLGLRLLIRRLS
jgi:RNase P protein component